jgi:hypothetical protein
MKCFLSSCLTLATALLLSQSAFAQNRAPAIDHSPVKLAVRGQNILFRAKVTDDANAVQSVTLFYSVSRDAAPYKVAMNPAGAGVYMGTVSADLTAGLQQLLYYIEAKDTLGAVDETPWYPVEIKAGTPVASPGPATRTTTAPGKESSWKKPALIAGGALAVGGAALAIMGGGGGDSGGGGGGTATNAAGTYAGTASVYFQPPGGSLVSSTYPITIAISSKGVVTSDNLYEGAHLEGQLSGSSFQLVAPVNQADRNGEIRFIGMVNNNRIAGSVEGSATTPDGNGTYSGSFSAAK